MKLGRRFGIVGCGSWGTALAIVLNRAGCDVTMWGRRESLVDSIATNRINQRYLPGVFIDPAIRVTNNVRDIARHDVLVLAIPAQSIRTIGITLSDMTDTSTPLIIASKGIERGSALLMSEVLRAVLPNNPTVMLSGPNFAGETARGKPTACVLASENTALMERLQFMIGSDYFRPYLSRDIIGVQVGAAVKNVIALACGVVLGAGMGENARSAIMTRGLYEMMQLARAKGGDAATLQGLSGIGDLSLTCGSRQSRNMRFGMSIGQQGGVDDAMMEKLGSLTEGVMTASAVHDLALKLGVSMPICVAVADVLQQRISLADAVNRLLQRHTGYEFDVT